MSCWKECFKSFRGFFRLRVSSARTFDARLAVGKLSVAYPPDPTYWIHDVLRSSTEQLLHRGDIQIIHPNARDYFPLSCVLPFANGCRDFVWAIHPGIYLLYRPSTIG